MSGVVLANLLSIFLIRSLQSLPHHRLVADLSFFYRFFTDTALWKSGLSFLIQYGVFALPEALPNRTLSKLCYLSKKSSPQTILHSKSFSTMELLINNPFGKGRRIKLERAKKTVCQVLLALKKWNRIIFLEYWKYYINCFLTV